MRRAHVIESIAPRARAIRTAYASTMARFLGTSV